jgi:hypothetical protein
MVEPSGPCLGKNRWSGAGSARSDSGDGFYFGESLGSHRLAAVQQRCRKLFWPTFVTSHHIVLRTSII